MEKILDFFIHSLILFTFLSLFYYYYSSELSKDKFEKEIETIIDKNEIIYEIMWRLELDNSISEKEKLFHNMDPNTQSNNQMIFNYLLYANIILWMILIFVVYNINMNININNLLFSNVITFIIIGLGEFLFFKYVILEYKPVRQSFITQQFIEKLKFYINTK